MGTKSWLLSVVIAGLSLAGCGDDFGECGEGTVLSGDTCVRVNNAPCGEGTVYDPSTDTCVGQCGDGTELVNGECYPIPGLCSDGTMFDDGTCVPDIDGCGTGTVLVNGECVPADEGIPVDVEESPEPNQPDGDNVPAVFTGPTVGESVVLHGCLPGQDYGGGIEPDFDWFVFTTSSAALYEVTVDGTNGAAGAFAAGNDVENIGDYLFGGGAYTGADYVRFGLSLTGDTAKREMVIPTAGTHHLIIGDSRNIWTMLTGGGFPIPYLGAEDECYYVTVKNVGLPTTGTAVAAETETGGTLDNTVQFFSYAGTDGDLLLDAYLETDGNVVQGAVATLEAGTVVRQHSPDRFNNDAYFPVIDRGTATLIAVDHVVNAEFDGADFNLVLPELSRTMAMPDGSTGTLTHDTSNAPMYFYWDGTAGDVSHIVAAASAFGYWYLEEFSTSLNIAAGDWWDGNYAGSRDELFQLPVTSRYFFRFDADLANAATYTIDFDREDETPRDLGPGSSYPDSTMTADGMDWYRVSLDEWVQITGGPSATSPLGADPSLEGFPGGVVRLDQAEWDYSIAYFGDLAPANTARVHGPTLIPYNGWPGDSMLVRVVDNASGGNYDIALDKVPYIDLGELSFGEFASSPNTAIGEDEELFFWGRVDNSLTWSGASAVLSNFTSALQLVDYDPFGGAWSSYTPADSELSYLQIMDNQFFFSVRAPAADNFDLAVTGSTL